MRQTAESESEKLQAMAAACGVHCHERGDERKVYEMPLPEKMAAMRGFHARGNVYFDEGTTRARRGRRGRRGGGS